jgi:hypothetical protein
MTPRRFSAIASWLVPDDLRGSDIIGDWIEIHAQWREAHGAGRAAALLAVDVVRSLPGLMALAFAERGWRGLVTRSLPAVFLGYATFAIAAALATGFSEAPGLLSFAVALAGTSALSLLAGWIAGSVAGAAPRQHGLLVGLGLAVTGAALAMRGAVDPAIVVTPFLVVIVVAASLGGACGRPRRPR